MGMTLQGEVDVEYEEELDGHRTYDLTWLVITDDKWIGPYSVSQCPGLPIPGTAWQFGLGGENDPYAYCQRFMRITPKVTAAPNFWWLVRQRFSTRPFERPQTNPYSNPLDEPPIVRGGFNKYTEEALRALSLTIVEDGVSTVLTSSLIRNSAWERFTGKNVEFERNRPHVSITMNIADAGDNYAVFSAYIDHVNDDVLWGFPTRCVKFSDLSFEKLYTVVDTPHLAATLDFDVDVRKNTDTSEIYSGHDRRLINYGDRELADGGNVSNPTNFKAYRMVPDREKSKVILTAGGTPWLGGGDGEPPYIKVKYYPEANFLDLGIPASI